MFVYGFTVNHLVVNCLAEFVTHHKINSRLLYSST